MEPDHDSIDLRQAYRCIKVNRYGTERPTRSAFAMKKFFAAAFFGAAMCFSALASAASPTEQQVQAALSRGDYAGAQQMLAEVVQDHPRNARAHYLYAQVLDRNGHATDALAQLNLAHQADPAMSFTQPSRLATVEQHIRADAARSGGMSANTAPVQTAAAPMMAPPVQQHSGTSPLSWLAIILVLAAVVGILVWGVRRARRNDEGRSQDTLRAQLKQATELLNAVRALKLDIRISTTPGHDLMAREADDLEAQLLRCVENLSAGLSGQQNTLGDQYDRIDSLGRQFESLKARVDGRPDPYPPHSADGNQYANEADRFSANRQPAQQTVIVQQPGGGGMGMGGGLLTGVLLGEMMGGGRERVIERDVIVDDERNRGGSDPGIDYGQGNNDWSDGGGGGGGIDMGGGGSDWSDN